MSDALNYHIHGVDDKRDEERNDHIVAIGTVHLHFRETVSGSKTSSKNHQSDENGDESTGVSLLSGYSDIFPDDIFGFGGI